MLARPITVTATGLARMLRLHHLGPVHPVIQTAAVWQPPELDRTEEAAVWSEFDRTGLLRRTGRLDGDVHDALAALGQPAVEFFGWIIQQGKSASALVAARGDEAVRVLRRANTVKLSSIPARGLAEELVDLMAGPSPARIESVNIRRDVLRTTEQDSDSLLLDARDPGTPELSTIGALLAQPVTGLGELYAGTRDQQHGYRVTQRPVGFRDTQVGRVMVATSDDYVSIAPGTNARLVARLQQNYHDLTKQQRIRG